MIKTYLVDGQVVTVTAVYRQRPPVYTIRVAGRPTAGTVERTALGRYRAVDSQLRLLGTYLGLQEAVERMVRAEPPRG